MSTGPGTAPEAREARTAPEAREARTAPRARGLGATGPRIRAGWVTLTGTGTAVSAVLALLVVAIVFVAVAAPRASLGFRDKALRQLADTTPPAGLTVAGTTDYASLGFALGYIPGSPGSQILTGQLADIQSELAGNLTHVGLPLKPAAQQWSGLATGYAKVTGGAARSAYDGSDAPSVEVLFRTGLGQFARIAAGRLPTSDSVTSRSATFDVAVTAATAARFGLHPGSALHLGSITLAVSGILRPKVPGSAFWTADPNAAVPAFQTFAHSTAGYWLGAVFVGPAEFSDLQATFNTNQMRLFWQFPLDISRVNANQVGRFYNELNRSLLSAGVLTTSVSSPMSVILSSGVIGALQTFVQAQDQIGSLLSLLYISLAMVGAVVLLLASRLLAERRAAEFGLMRARGAAFPQLAGLALRAGLVVVIPAAVAGTAAAVALTPGGDEPLAWWLGGLTTLVALVSVPALAVRRTPATGLATERADSTPTRTWRARRLVVDATLVAASVGGLVVLRQQGPPPPGGTDLFTSAAPVLVAIPMAVVVVRLYPLGVRWLLRLAGRRHGLAVFVGLARAVRSSLTAVLPVFALVLALAVIAFGATLRAAVVRGQVAASWQATGADAVIDGSQSTVPFGPAARRAISAVPGVEHAAAADVIAAQTANGTALSLLLVDPASYAALVAATPQPAFPASTLAKPAGFGTSGSAANSAPLPVLTSPAASGLIGQRTKVLVGIYVLKVRAAGQIVSTPAAIGSSNPFIVLPYWAATGVHPGPPSLMLVVGQHLDSQRLQAVVRRVLPGGTVSLRSTLLASLTGAPLPHGAFVTFAQGAAAAAGFGAAILLILLVLGARQRELTLARLATMGLSAGQARRLVFAETLPSILAAAIGGIACAAVLVPLIGPAIDLSVLTGTGLPVPVRADFPVLGYAAAGLLVVALATLITQAIAIQIRGTTRALRVGE